MSIQNNTLLNGYVDNLKKADNTPSTQNNNTVKPNNSELEQDTVQFSTKEEAKKPTPWGKILLGASVLAAGVVVFIKRKDVGEFLNKSKELQVEIESQYKKLGDLNESIKNKNDEIQNLEKQLKELNNNVTTNKTEKQKLETEIQKQKEELEKLKNETTTPKVDPKNTEHTENQVVRKFTSKKAEEGYNFLAGSLKSPENKKFIEDNFEVLNNQRFFENAKDFEKILPNNDMNAYIDDMRNRVNASLVASESVTKKSFSENSSDFMMPHMNDEDKKIFNELKPEEKQKFLEKKFNQYLSTHKEARLNDIIEGRCKLLSNKYECLTPITKYRPKEMNFWYNCDNGVLNFIKENEKNSDMKALLESTEDIKQLAENIKKAPAFKNDDEKNAFIKEQADTILKRKNDTTPNPTKPETPSNTQPADPELKPLQETDIILNDIKSKLKNKETQEIIEKYLNDNRIPQETRLESVKKLMEGLNKDPEKANLIIEKIAENSNKRMDSLWTQYHETNDGSYNFTFTEQVFNPFSFEKFKRLKTLDEQRAFYENYYKKNYEPNTVIRTTLATFKTYGI